MSWVPQPISWLRLFGVKVNCGEKRHSTVAKSGARGIPRTLDSSSTASDTHSSLSPWLCYIPLPSSFAEMDLLQTSAAQTWEQPPSVDEQQDEHLEERPRKKRRKYIARAWYVPFRPRRDCFRHWLMASLQPAMNASVAKLNAMAKRHAIGVVDSTSSVSTWRIHDGTAWVKMSMEILMMYCSTVGNC